MRTRNARLTAIHSLVRNAAFKTPEQAELIARVIAIPDKRFDTTVVSYLTEPEIDALPAAPLNTPSLAAIGHPTRYSPFSKASDLTGFQ